MQVASSQVNEKDNYAYSYTKLIDLLSSGGEVGYLEYCYRKPKYLLAYLFTMWSLMNRSSGVASQGDYRRKN